MDRHASSSSHKEGGRLAFFMPVKIVVRTKPRPLVFTGLLSQSSGQVPGEWGLSE